MARYLTPVRLGILILTEQYLSGQFASSGQLGVLSFIASHIAARGGSTGKDDQDAFVGLDAHAAEILGPLAKFASDVPGRTAYDALLQRLWKLDSLDAAYELFERLGEVIAPGSEPEEVQKVVSRASTLSQLIRRCSVEFTRLQFADTQALWVAFVAWRASTYDVWAQRNPDAAARYVELATSSGDHPANARRPTIEEEGRYVSAEDTNDLITSSVHHLQKMGTRVPDVMRRKLQSWIHKQRDAGVQSLQHFLAFFEHWRSGQYTMALESLHRYFDYSLIGKGTSGGTDNMRIYYQYALLHLSVLHADFDCWEESVDAMDECIATARENQDTACLNFALSWLLYLRQAKPDNRVSAFGSVSGLLGGAAGEQDEISFLKAKARETKHWSLLSSTLLEEAKLDMYTVPNMHPEPRSEAVTDRFQTGSTTKSVELIMQSAFVNVQHDLRTLMPATSLFEGAAFDRLAQSQLAARAHDTIQIVYGDQAPLSDRTRSLCRTAYGIAQSGRCSAGLDMLRDFLPCVNGVLKLEQRLMGFMNLLQLMGSLRKCVERLDAAAYYHSQLLPLRSLGDPELDFELDLLEIDLYIRQRDLGTAMKAMNVHIRQTEGHSPADIAHRLHFLVLKSTIFALSGQAAKGFSIALRAASTAARLRLLPTLLEAIAALATVLNDLSEFDAARRLLDAILPMMIETRNCRLTARSFVTLGEAHVGFAGTTCTPNSSERLQQIRAAEAHIERGRELYVRLDDTSGVLDCLVMKAQLARWRGDEQLAARADAQYAQILRDRHEAAESHYTGLAHST
ncbi:APC5 protein [Friedmanniomyces endolithicus]|uniref:Anaphase-promoting complex subunit 5 n=1 Tax=Friedmanniomyces endolithicus TaxID=329885 RepID=A0AAN6R287_9PEZI|nr:APC5 protein [Friedmanniomyces endolithicus]KAK0980832.1 APC5 protein [Friedmanniomyces endolithicus]KAK1015646.1 APC5 protein [Friedmanniomyces endolithicus]KAK1044331.1 APC5 protein [Friedmanniomyces endolithicus]